MQVLHVFFRVFSRVRLKAIKKVVFTVAYNFQDCLDKMKIRTNFDMFYKMAVAFSLKSNARYL